MVWMKSVTDTAHILANRGVAAGRTDLVRAACAAARLANPDHLKNMVSLVEGGMPTVMAQVSRIILHSRMKAGIARYASAYPNRDILLFEPNQRDADMFFARIFSFDHRRRVCEHAYQTTRNDLRERQCDLQSLLSRYGITLRTDILADRARHFDSHLHIPPEVARLPGLRHPVTNELSHALDTLDAWLAHHSAESEPDQAPRAKAG